MKTDNLNTDDKKRIAHFLAERAASIYSKGETTKALEEYTETFDKVYTQLSNNNND